jgi:hypothetical protein
LLDLVIVPRIKFCPKTRASAFQTKIPSPYFISQAQKTMISSTQALVIIYQFLQLIAPKLKPTTILAY